MVRCWDSVSTTMAMNPRTAASTRTSGSAPTSAGSIDVATISGCAASRSACWVGK